MRVHVVLRDGTKPIQRPRRIVAHEGRVNTELNANIVSAPDSERKRKNKKIKNNNEIIKENFNDAGDLGERVSCCAPRMAVFTYPYGGRPRAIKVGNQLRDICVFVLKRAACRADTNGLWTTAAAEGRLIQIIIRTAAAGACRPTDRPL